VFLTVTGKNRFGKKQVLYREPSGSLGFHSEMALQPTNSDLKQTSSFFKKKIMGKQTDLRIVF
jgi:hypothetical protein